MGKLGEHLSGGLRFAAFRARHTFLNRGEGFQVAQAVEHSPVAGGVRHDQLRFVVDGQDLRGLRLFEPRDVGFMVSQEICNMLRIDGFADSRIWCNGAADCDPACLFSAVVDGASVAYPHDRHQQVPVLQLADAVPHFEIAGILCRGEAMIHGIEVSVPNRTFDTRRFTELPGPIYGLGLWP